MPVSIVLLLLSGCQDQGVTAFNANPTAAILSHRDGDAVKEGEPVTLRGAGADPDNGADELVSTWWAGARQICPPTPTDAQGGTTCEATLTTEEGRITLDITDPANAAASASIDLRVEPTAAPVAAITSPVTGSRWYADQAITFEGQVTDAEDPPSDLVVTWESDRDGLLAASAVPDASGQLTGLATLSAGEHVVTLQAVDTSGKAGTAQVAVSVGPANSAPTCALATPDDGGVGLEGTAVVLSGTVGDVDEAATGLAVTLSSDHDGPLGTPTPDTAGQVTFTTTSLSVATHVLTLQVTDGRGATCSDIRTWKVGQAPWIRLTSPASSTLVDEGEALVASAEVGDPDGVASQVSLSWTSSVDGLLAEGLADGTGNSTVVLPSLSVGLHELVATATDPDGFSSWDTVSLRVNGAPSAPVVVLSPSPATTDVDLVATLAAPSVDPDGDSVSYTWTWYRNGILSPVSASDILPASATSRGESWRVVVTPSDGLTAGPAGEATVSIVNSAPQVLSLVLSPSPARTEDTLVAGASTTDADGDAVTLGYAWTVNGVPVWTGSTLDGRVFFDKGDEVQVTATPGDGSDTGSAFASGTLTVANTAPEAPGITIVPEDPVMLEDDLVCTVTRPSTDADGDDVDYTMEWTYEGGVEYPFDFDPTDGVDPWVGPLTTSWPDDTVPAEDSWNAWTWTCTVTPSDGESDGTSAATSVMVSEAVTDWSGTYALDSTVRYSCAYSMVNMNVSALTVTDAWPSILVSSAGTQPGTMSGVFTSETSFQVQNRLSGTCTETYTLTGTFVDDVTFEGTLEAAFSGMLCFDCSDRTWSVTGTR